MDTVSRMSGEVVRRSARHVGFCGHGAVGTGVLFLGLVVLFPVGSLFLYALASGPTVFWESISSPEAIFSLKFTVLLATATTAINGVMGTVVAFMLVKREFPLKGLFESLVALPVAIPASVTGFTLLLLYGPPGLIGQSFEAAGIKIMFAFPGLLLAHVFVTLPFVVGAVGRVLREVDVSQEEVAETMGASGIHTFWSVVLPAIKGGLIAGCIFTFARSLGEFGATIMVSGNLALRTQNAPIYIFSEFNKGNIEAANSMSVVLVIISFALYMAFKTVTQRTETVRLTSANGNIA